MIKIAKFRLLLYLILLAIIVFLVCMYIVPSGHIIYTYNFRSNSDFIGKLTPKDRVIKPSNGEQIIIGNPVYFSLRTPRKFDQAKITLKYKNKEDHLLVIESGVLVDKDIWRYDLKPVQNKTIDRIFQDWTRIKQKDTLFLQRKSNYASIEQFLKDMPLSNQIALYNYDLPKKYYLSNYQPGREYNMVNYHLRGAYQFYTYIYKEDLNFSFLFKDLNLNKDADNIEILVYDQNDNLVYSQKIEDDGIAEITAQESETRRITIRRPNLPVGAYKIEFKANDDIITMNLITTQSKLSFINRLWLSNPNQRIVLYSDSQDISLQTINPASLQTATVNGQPLTVPNTYEQFTLISRAPVNMIRLAKGDVIISGKGVFSFNRENLINPNYKSIDNNFRLTNNIQYVLADYESPKHDEYKVSELEVDLSNAYMEEDKYSFLISIPGLKSEDELADSIIIKQIKVELTGKSLWQKLKE
ncbi:MAG: hypothetical protein ABIG10_01765 [bacterium]